MSQAYTGRKRIRRSFGRIPQVVEMPNLIEVQKYSYDQFLQTIAPEEGREEKGLQAVFNSVFPIEDFAGASCLEFVTYQFDPPKYDVEECQQRGMTYAAPLKVKLRLIVYDVDEETEVKSIRGVKEQDVYMGDLPLMTSNGTFVVNGTERVIVSQMHRSPGVFFDHDKGKTHASGKLLFAARIIPYRGSWLDFEFDAKDILHVRIDRRRKLPATTILHALDFDNEEILSIFYDKVTFTRKGDQWITPFDKESRRGTKPVNDLINAKNGKVIVEAGKKISPRLANKLVEDGVQDLLVNDFELIGRFLAEELINMDTGEIYAEAGDEITEDLLADLIENGYQEISTLNTDPVNKGPFIRNTLMADKSSDKATALEEIYRVMRPGEPPTPETAEALFTSLFFDEERYDLSAVGRVKMNIRMDLDCSDEIRILRKEDVVEVMRTLVNLRDGKGDIDDIDNSR